MCFTNPAWEPSAHLSALIWFLPGLPDSLFLVCINSLVRKISLSSFSSGLSVSTSCLSQGAVFQGPPHISSTIRVATCRAVCGWGQSALADPAWPYQPFAGRSQDHGGCRRSPRSSRVCLSFRLQSKPGHEGSWPGTPANAGTVSEQPQQGACPARGCGQKDHGGRT